MLSSCSQRATNSLPVPFCPVMKMRASVGATRCIISLILWIASDSPIISYDLLTLRFSTLVSVTSLVLSVALRMVISRRFRSSGLEMKSKAPFLMASTAVSILPWPEIITTVASGSLSCILPSTSMPSILGILISQSTTSKWLFSIFSSPSKPSSATSTSNFSYSNISLRVLRMLRSSSITRILVIVFAFFNAQR